jgi:glycine/D-amino acid oxidase-like deaminating enzyme
MKKRSIHHSPWLAQLKKNRPTKSLNKNAKTDVLIIGAGIAGMVTAHYLLKDTKNRVIIVDAGKMAHGATGHNAGQIASYFEYPFDLLVKEYGFEKAIQAQSSIIQAWDLLDHIVQEAELKSRPLSFSGFAGCTSVKQVISHLRRAIIRCNGRLQVDFAYIEDDPRIIRQIPKKYKELYAAVPKANILRKLETTDKTYIAATTIRKGCMNSAKFCEELLDYFHRTYKHRFALYENTPVDLVTAKKSKVVAKANGKTIETKQVILCTNGYKKLKLSNEVNGGKTAYAGLITNIVGFMAGYEQSAPLGPVAISYFPKNYGSNEDPYFYLTRRPLKDKKKLVCIGGPETMLSDKEEYDQYKHYNTQGLAEIKTFLKKSHKHTPKNARYLYQWEGLMGYTKDRIRCVGKDPYNPRIWYNLGCNGVGIMPSIYGAKRISLLMKGVNLKRSLFDPGYSIRGKLSVKKERIRKSKIVKIKK